MIIILKIILAFIIILGISVIKALYKDFKTTTNSIAYEDATVIDKLKIKSILYFSIIGTLTFCLLMLYYVVAPMTIMWWW